MLVGPNYRKERCRHRLFKYKKLREGFKSDTVTKDKGEHCVFRTCSVHKDCVTILNIYVPSNRQSHYIEQTLIELKEEIGRFKITIGDSKSPFPKWVEQRGQKVSEGILDSTNTTSRLD